MSFHSMIAGRYFSSNKKSRFLPLLTFISISGVALGVISLVVVLSVMQGFSGELQRRFIGFNAHITITKSAGLQATVDDISKLLPKDKVIDIIPFAEGEAIAMTNVVEDQVASGIKVHGIKDQTTGTLKTIDYYFPVGSNKFEELKSDDISTKLPGIIIGGELASVLMVHPDFDDKIEIVAPLSQVGPTGEMEPRLRSYRLIGAFRSGVYEYDNKVVFVSLDEAKKLLGAQAVEGFKIVLKHPKDAPVIAAGLSKKMGEGYEIESWDRQNKKLFAALKLERLAMSIILLLIILIASSSIVGVLMMVVASKRKDVAIMRTFGMNKKDVRRVFLIYGVRIGIIGSIVGAVTGSLLCIGLTIWPIRLPQSYYLDILPVYWSPLWSSVFLFTGVIIAVLAAIYPVSQAVSEDPIVTLRYE